MTKVKGNKDSEIAVIVLWTNIDVAKKKVDRSKYVLMSNLFSKEEGISNIIRGLLANKNIRHLVVCGVDMRNTGKALVTLFDNIKGIDFELDKELTEKQIQNVIANVKVHDLREKKLENINDYLASLPKLGRWGENEEIKPHEILTSQNFVSEGFGYQIQEDYLSYMYRRLLNLILKLGESKELTGVRCLINKEDINNLMRADFFPEFKDPKWDLNKKDIIKELKEKNVVIVDVNGENLVDLSFINTDKLHLTARFVNLEVFHRFLNNAYWLRKIQTEIANTLDKEVGSTSLNLLSCYIDDLNDVKDFLDKYPPRHGRISDPRGNLVITVEEKQILIKHLDTNGKRLEMFHAGTAKECINWLIENYNG